MLVVRLPVGAQTPRAEVRSDRAVTADVVTVIAALFIVAGLGVNAVVGNQAGNTIVPAGRRVPVHIAVFQIGLWQGDQ
ncbi:hypothetical protein BvCmsKKP036_02031 [Escherichia coli]|nr:hypothetical protein BvCmsKKP036_02031 [Escherichia coli]